MNSCHPNGFDEADDRLKELIDKNKLHASERLRTIKHRIEGKKK